MAESGAKKPILGQSVEDGKVSPESKIVKHGKSAPKAVRAIR